ncbi:YihY/virulence factor BrkB family protein [Bacillus changyiensis]|uniref:YihY/virulence factor BrkB family protein n=1 Tax=Bacillus changyiensis TaxID=3004103 RepID=UPI0022E54F8B|nr:YhjD/YihY/BrkB family envelope integrity protein [Bacillus changyiensis]MDA1477216.1 YihY family inner membrane protein [Bacillus changyiensis]
MNFLKKLAGRFLLHEGFSKSAELAYFFLLSLFPFMIFLITLVGYLPVQKEDIIAVFKQYAPKGTMPVINETLNTGNRGLLSFGIIAALWSASNGIGAIVGAFNHAYEVKENRSFLMIRLTSLLLTVAMVMTILIALLLPVFGRAIGDFIASIDGTPAMFLTAWSALRWIISPLILFIVFTALYFFAPNERLSFKFVFPGACAATVGWILVSILFSYYVSEIANYSATYGSLGGIIVLMIWFYLSGMMIILGGEINALLHKNSAHRAS